MTHSYITIVRIVWDYRVSDISLMCVFFSDHITIPWSSITTACDRVRCLCNFYCELRKCATIVSDPRRFYREVLTDCARLNGSKYSETTLTPCKRGIVITYSIQSFHFLKTLKTCFHGTLCIDMTAAWLHRKQHNWMRVGLRWL